MLLDLLKKLSVVWGAIVEYINDLKGLNMKMKVTVGVLFSVTVICLMSSGLFGCASPNEMYINSNYKHGTVAIPLLKEYTSNDSTLLDVEKKARVNSLDVWLKQINQAKYELETISK